jgi:hypothetical protein
MCLGIPAVAGPGCSKPTLESEVQSFIKGSGFTFDDCGALDLSSTCTEGPPPAAATCFLNAFDACTPVRVDVTRYTVEGDPIYSTLLVVPHGSLCQVKQFVDSREDAYGSGELTQFTCDLVNLTPSCADPIALENCSPDCNSDGVCD